MNRIPAMNRRRFLSSGAALVATGTARLSGASQDIWELPFENGSRPLVRYPQKRPLIRHTSRPPQLETPFPVFGEGEITPNDAFFVRYHLAPAPPAPGLLAPDAFRVKVRGAVGKPADFSVAELRAGFEVVEITAVNQCSGNGRGFFNPRVPGGQLGNGAMGCARWRGVRLRDVLHASEPSEKAKDVLFDGLDRPLLPATPDFVKTLPIDHAMAAEPLLAFEMNGEPLPWLNGFPLRLVVPGYYGTYWVKHLHDIRVLDEPFTGYWMNTAYRIPDEPCAAIPPGTKPGRTIPINRMNVRSFLTNLADGAAVHAHRTTLLEGIAFDGGAGIREVLVSEDDGRSWTGATLGPDPGPYAFRKWTTPWKPKARGPVVLRIKATNKLGESQPMEPLWNPSGYMRNVAETIRLKVS
jgi:sulfite dehydrogenase (cytochrome) subunit A